MQLGGPKPISGKTSWPNVVGKTGQQAKQEILKDFPQADIHIIKENQPVTMDYRTNRVRITVNGQNKVVSAPMIG